MSFGTPSLIAVIYAKDVQRLARFYEEVLSLSRAEERSGFTLLVSDDLELSIVQVPEAIAVSIKLTEPPEIREDTPIKLSFRVCDIERVRPTIQHLGGGLKRQEAAWSWRGAKHLDGWDPEGNVIQLQQGEAQPAAEPHRYRKMEGDRMKLGAARIFVRDIIEARRFYKNKLGLSLEGYSQEAGYCIFDTGPTKLIVECIEADAALDDQALVGRFTGLSFPVDDINAVQQRLASLGIEFSGSPEKQHWGGWLSAFKDPDGNGLQLVQYAD